MESCRSCRRTPKALYFHGGSENLKFIAGEMRSFLLALPKCFPSFSIEF